MLRNRTMELKESKEVGIMSDVIREMVEGGRRARAQGGHGERHGGR